MLSLMRIVPCVICANSQWFPVLIAMTIDYVFCMCFLFSTRLMTYCDLLNVVSAKNEFNTLYGSLCNMHILSIIYKYPLMISSLSHFPILSVLYDLAVNLVKKLSCIVLMTLLGYFLAIAHNYLICLYV